MLTEIIVASVIDTKKEDPVFLVQYVIWIDQHTTSSVKIILTLSAFIVFDRQAWRFA